VTQPDRLQLLLNAVRRLTEPFGKKAALARELGVTRQHVNAWLVGIHEPSGRIALELAEWVRLEDENQKKTRPARQRRPGKQTRKGNSEKSKTGPPRRRL